MTRDEFQEQQHIVRWEKYRTRETGLPSYSKSELAALEQKLSGRIQVAGEPGYNEDRMVFVKTYPQFPQVIIYCECETDVVAALEFARTSVLQVVVRSGGHNTAGFSVNDQVVIDTSGMNHVAVDTETPAIYCGPGVKFRKLNRMLDYYNLHLPGGGCETVNVAGYMMGGGYGFTSRLYGMNCDRVVGVKLALPDGRIVTANASENPDLFWAVRGGTGNQFGVLLEIKYNPVHLNRNFLGFGLRWNLRDGNAEDIERVCSVIELLQAKFSTSGLPKMGHQALLMYLPDASTPPKQVACFCLRGLYDGSSHDAREALQPLIERLLNPETDIEIWTDEYKYARLNEVLFQSADPPGDDIPPFSAFSRTVMEGWLIKEHCSANRWRAVVEHFLKAPDKTCFIDLEFYGGAIAEPKPTDMAFVHRDASLDLFCWAFWMFDSHQSITIEWLDELGAIVGPMGNGERYQNYQRRGTEGFLEAYFGENLLRLQHIKARVDPDNIFWFEQSLGQQPTEPAQQTDD